MNVTRILSIDKGKRLVWVGFNLTRTVTDRDTDALARALKSYGIAYSYIATSPSGKLGKTFDQISVALPYPAGVFKLQEKYEIFKSAKNAIEQIVSGKVAAGFQARRLFCGDLAITQLYQKHEKEAVNVG